MENDLNEWCLSVGHAPLVVAHTYTDGSPNQFKYSEAFERVSRHQTCSPDDGSPQYGCHSYDATAHGKGNLYNFELTKLCESSEYPLLVLYSPSIHPLFILYSSFIHPSSSRPLTRLRNGDNIWIQIH